MIAYKNIRPTVAEYKYLFKCAEWSSFLLKCDNEIQIAIDNSWYWVTVFDENNIIGMGRIVSDGVLYAFICDMIVIPSYQNHKIGKTIINKLKEKCIENKFTRVWLFAAPGKAEFYIKNGFEKRPVDAPGMQLKNIQE
jgi:ribosomal protein S18 acetylase RimI-like enzyme